jgi:5-methylthioadenosine/S-adenosylhomocysteine deaminase
MILSTGEEVDLLIRDCAILTLDHAHFITQGAIAVKDKKIIYVGRKDSLPRVKAERAIDAHGKVAMPGMVNCHTHVAMTLFRGLAEDKPLDAWLRKDIWPLEAKLTWEDVYWGALLGCVEMLKTGTTCFADMYFYEDAVARAVEDSGLRAVLAQGIIELKTPALGKETFKQSIDFVQNFHGAAEGRIRTWFGPHAVYSCSLELLREVRRAASEKNVGIHIHLAESSEQAEKLYKKYGVSETCLLEKIGVLGSDVLAAHCIFLSKKDMQLLRKHNVKVGYNPVANAKLGTAVSPIKELMDLGVHVGIGTDGPASNNSLDMFWNMRFAALAQKLRYKDATVMNTRKVVEMATLGGARTLGLENMIGSIEVGKRADIILVDFNKPHLKPFHDVHANLVYSTCGSDVDIVIIDGRILIEKGEVKVLDEAKVMSEAEKRAFRLISK